MDTSPRYRCTNGNCGAVLAREQTYTIHGCRFCSCCGHDVKPDDGPMIPASFREVFEGVRV